MRILLVTPYFYPAEAFGGPVKVAFDVGKELVKRGHEVVVFTSDAKDLENRFDVESDEVEGMKVCYFRNLSMHFVRWSKLFITPELSKKMKSDLKSFDVVHAHEYTTYQNVIVHRFAKKYVVPYVLQAHGSLPKIGRQARKWLYDVFFGSNLLKDASKVVALSQTEAEQYKWAGVPNEKIAIIPNGIDLSEYHDLPSRGAFKRSFGLNDEEKIVLYLGRIHRIKGIDILVRAFGDIVGKMDEVKLVVAGPDDGYLSELKALVKSLKIEDKVLISGPLYGRDKLEAYVDADVYVLPSRYETFPMSILEAVACGTPVILTENCGIADYFRDKVGLVVEPDSDDLSEALTEVLHGKSERDLFKGNCRTVIEGFSISKTASKLEEVYRKIVQ